MSEWPSYILYFKEKYLKKGKLEIPVCEGGWTGQGGGEGGSDQRKKNIHRRGVQCMKMFWSSKFFRTRQFVIHL